MEELKDRTMMNGERCLKARDESQFWKDKVDGEWNGGKKFNNKIDPFGVCGASYV